MPDYENEESVFGYVDNDYKAENSLKRGLPNGHVKIKNYLSIPVFENNKVVAVIAVGNKDFDYVETDIQELSILMDRLWKIVKQKLFDIIHLISF